MVSTVNVAFIAEVDIKLIKQALDLAYSIYSTPIKNNFIKYKTLNLKVNNVRLIKGINSFKYILI